MSKPGRFSRLLAGLVLFVSGAGSAGALAEGARVGPAIQHPVVQRIVALDAPSNLGLRPPSPGALPGARKLPDALRRTGLLRRLGAKDAGRVDAPAYSARPDRNIGFRNGASLQTYSQRLAERLTPLLAQGDFVLVLGGDCSVLLGSGVALKGRGRYGLAFVDAHDDFAYARDRKRYEGYFSAAGLDLGLATGHGPQALVDILGRAPYFREADVVHIGLSREQADLEFSEVEAFDNSAIAVLGIDDIQRRGADAVGADAARRLRAAPTEGYWIHVDADVLDRTIMPAVDSPNPRGLSYAQLRTLLTHLLADPKAVGLELTILDPDLDPHGRYAAEFARTIEQAFRDSGRFALPATSPER